MVNLQRKTKSSEVMGRKQSRSSERSREYDVQYSLQSEWGDTCGHLWWGYEFWWLCCFSLCIVLHESAALRSGGMQFSQTEFEALVWDRIANDGLIGGRRVSRTLVVSIEEGRPDNSITISSDWRSYFPSTLTDEDDMWLEDYIVAEEVMRAVKWNELRMFEMFVMWIVLKVMEAPTGVAVCYK